MAGADLGSSADMEDTSGHVVNDQTGESSPGVIEQVERGGEADIPVSPTPEPAETAQETEAAGEGR
jgi:hypothetical protein